MGNKSKSKIFVFVTLFVFLLVSFGLTLKMNFWRDDYSMLFKLQHPEEQAGHFGKGLVGSGSYKYILLPHAPFYPIFKFNPQGYFAIGLIIYAGAMYSLYLLANELLKSPKAAAITSLVFAAGYIASDGMFRIINSWQNSYGQILAVLTFWAYVKYFHHQKIGYYFLAILLYFISIEFVFVRSHAVIAGIVASDLIFGFLPNLSGHIKHFKEELMKLTVRLAPFGALFYIWYFKSGSPVTPGLESKFSSLFLNGNLSELSPLFANIGNVLIPDKAQVFIISSITNRFLRNESIDGQIFWLSLAVSVFSFVALYLFARFVSMSKKYSLIMLVPLFITIVLNLKFYSMGLYWYKDVQTVISGLLGMNSFVFSLFIFVALWNKNRPAAACVFLGWIIIASQIFGYYIYYTDAILESTHRYLAQAFLGYSLLLGGLASIFLTARAEKGLIKIKYLGLGIIFLIVLMNLKLNLAHELKFVNEISTPSKIFYGELKANVPGFEKGSLFYFDVKDSSFYRHQLDEFFSVGSMPNSTAIADYYDVDRYDLILTDNYAEVLTKIRKKEVNLNNVYTFYYGENGLKNTSSDFRRLLLNGGQEISGIISPVEFENKLTLETDVSSLSPLLLQMDIYPKVLFDKLGGEATSGLKKYSLSEKLGFISYMKSKYGYYKESKAAALSDWQYQKTANILDNDATTLWRGDRLYWNSNHHEAVTIDLGKVKMISKVIWINGNHYFSPISYTVGASYDGKTWINIKKVEDAQEKKDNELVIEEFPPTLARYIKMDITKTPTDDSPAISEIEVIEDKYSGVDISQVDNFISSPFLGTTETNELKEIYTAFLPLAKITVSIKTNKGEISGVVQIPIALDKEGYYSSVIPAYGTNLENLTLEIKNVPVFVRLLNLSVKNLNFSELDERGLIKEN